MRPLGLRSHQEMEATLKLTQGGFHKETIYEGVAGVWSLQGPHSTQGSYQ